MNRRTPLLLVLTVALSGCAYFMHTPAPDRAQWAETSPNVGCRTPPATHYFDAGLTLMYAGGGTVAAIDGKVSAALVAFLVAGASAASAVWGFYSERDCAAFREFQIDRPAAP